VAKHQDVQLMAANRAERALADWIAELPAHLAALDAEGGVRKVLLDDLIADAPLLSKAEAAGAHPVLLARGHLAQGVAELLLAQETSDEAGADRGLEHLEAAFDIAVSLQASGPRLELVGQVGAMVASGLDVLRASQRRAAGRLLGDIGEAFGLAFAEQLEEAERGTITLAAAQALAQGAKVVRGKARIAVLERSVELARDARRDLIRSAELAKADLAKATIKSLETTIAKSAAAG
jgi:hypothetical protein